MAAEVRAPSAGLTADEVRKIEPRLTQRVKGAVYEEESTQLDSYRLTLALAQAAEKNGNARLLLRPCNGL